MPRPARPRLQESDMPAEVRARLAARRAESETPEFQARHAEEVARLQREFPPLQPDELLLEALATLRRERERQGLTLADVSDLSGIDPTTISKLENGRLSNPTYSTMRAYARALDMAIGWTVQASPWEVKVCEDGCGVFYVMVPAEDAGSLHEYLLSWDIACRPPEVGASVGKDACKTISLDPGVDVKRVRVLVRRWKIIAQAYHAAVPQG